MLKIFMFMKEVLKTKNIDLTRFSQVGHVLGETFLIVPRTILLISFILYYIRLDYCCLMRFTAPRMI